LCRWAHRLHWRLAVPWLDSIFCFVYPSMVRSMAGRFSQCSCCLDVLWVQVSRSSMSRNWKFYICKAAHSMLLGHRPRLDHLWKIAWISSMICRYKMILRWNHQATYRLARNLRHCISIRDICWMLRSKGSKLFLSRDTPTNPFAIRLVYASPQQSYQSSLCRERRDEENERRRSRWRFVERRSAERISWILFWQFFCFF